MTKHQKKEIMQILQTVEDPEIPVLSILDLGIVRKVNVVEANKALITITPTYSGCPAMDMIAVNIKAALQEVNWESEIKTVLSPAWTTDWITEEGKRKLKEYGIAPPIAKTTDTALLLNEFRKVPCPRCQSSSTKMISQFGSTACKSLHQCNDCLEPFDYFKCH